MKKITQIVCVAVLLSMSFAQAVKAEILDYNHAFSYSEMGAEVIQYSEFTVLDINGAKHDLNMQGTVVNAMQRSGGYTPVSEFGGFYVQTTTTLSQNAGKEEWDISPFGKIQTNDRKMSWNELSILYAWQLDEDQSGYHIVAGGGAFTGSFTRFNFERTDGGIVTNGTVMEDALNVSLNAGFRYDSTFSDPDEETRLLWGVLLGTPAYYKVENSDVPDVQLESFFQGYDVSANFGYGIQLFNKFMLSMHVEGLYKFRPRISTGIAGGKTATVPDATIINVRSTLGVEWSY